MRQLQSLLRDAQSGQQPCCSLMVIKLHGTKVLQTCLCYKNMVANVLFSTTTSGPSSIS